MVGMAAVCWGIWTLRNRVTFEKYVIRNPAEGSRFVLSCFFGQGYRRKVIRRSWVRIQGS
jgi:hypothetical protein